MPVKLFSSEFFRWFFALDVDWYAEAELWSVLMYSRMSLSRLETLQSTPLFSNLTFYCASFWERSALNRSKCENSILRKRYYSFKHSGNLRGDHRGPEKVCLFCRSGLKMNDFLPGW